MFNVGGPEIVVILLVALMILGPDQLPKAMRTFGNVMAEIRKVSGGFQDEMRKAMDTIDIKGAERSSSPADKPHSATPPSGQLGDTGSAVGEPHLAEVVARNPEGPASAVADDDAVAATPDRDAVAEAPRVDPADRAAG